MKKDVQFLVECLTTELVTMLMDTYGWEMRRALDELYTSETYRKLCDPETGLYYQGAVYVFSFLQDEIENGALYVKK